MMDYNQKILDFLKEYIGDRTSREVGFAVGISTDKAYSLLVRLSEKGLVNRTRVGTTYQWSYIEPISEEDHQRMDEEVKKKVRTYQEPVVIADEPHTVGDNNSMMYLLHAGAHALRDLNKYQKMKVDEAVEKPERLHLLEEMKQLQRRKRAVRCSS